MNSEREDLIRRVLIALDTSEYSLAMLEAATDLAQRLSTGLDALFIEEDDLFAWAALPFARALDTSSGEVRQIDTAAVEKALKADAERIRNKLTSAATAKNVKVNFSVVRGRYVSAALAASAEQQVLLLCHTTSASVRFKRTPTTPEAAVAMIHTGSEQARRALSLAVDVAHQRSVPLKIWATGAETASALQTELQRRGVLDCEVSTVSDADIAPLIERISREPCGTLVLPREIADDEETRTALPKLTCPVYLVS